jgi:SAM-dependent methyltransferase
MERNDFWNKKHVKYSKEDWIRWPTYFAKEVAAYLPPQSRLLDVGAGQGQDSVYFESLGHEVVAMDFSTVALESFELADGSKCLHSLAEFPYPFESGAFDVIYSHLAIHYYGEEIAANIGRELLRLTKAGGLLCIMVNSIDDPEFGQGARLESDYYEVNPGDFKRYYSADTLKSLFNGSVTIQVLEQSGRTHKDPHSAFARIVAKTSAE